MRAYKAYGYGGKQYLSGGQTKLDKNNDGKISGEDFELLRKLKEYMNGGKMYENGGRPGRGEMLKQEGDTMVRYAMPTDEQLERNDGFFEPIPLDERDFKEEVQLPEELVGLERVAMRTKDPEAVAEYEAALAKFKDSPEYKEQLEAVRARRERAASQVAEAKAGYEGRKAEYDKMREAMRVIMNSRLMD